MRENTSVLIVPGLRDHVADHWQTHLEARLSKVRKVISVPPLEANKLSCEARVQAIERTIRTMDGPMIVVAHSGGVVMLVHWAQKYAADIQGALLAAPPDFATPLPASYPTREVLEANDWLPVPRKALPFRSIVAASTNDPLASLASVEQMACDWHSELVNVGAVGHLNPVSGFGVWPQAEQFIQMLDW